MLPTMTTTGLSLTKRALVISAVGGALCLTAAGPAGAATVGLLKTSQLPSGYKQIGKTTTISGSSILTSTKTLGGGLGAATTGCKGAPGAASLKGYTAHLAIFEKGASEAGLSILGEVVFKAPSAAAATKYLTAVKAATASCSGTQSVKMSGETIKVSYKSHNTSISKAGADAAVGTVVALTADTTIDGVKATVKGSLGVETYRKGADIVELIVDDFGVKADEASKSVTVTFSPGSSATVTKVGKAAIKDL